MPNDIKQTRAPLMPIHTYYIILDKLLLHSILLSIYMVLMLF